MPDLTTQDEKICERFYKLHKQGNNNMSDWVIAINSIKYAINNIYDLAKINDTENKDKPAIYLMNYNYGKKNDIITLGVILKHPTNQSFIRSPTLEETFYNGDFTTVKLNTYVLFNVIDDAFVKEFQDSMVLLVDYLDFLAQKLAEDEAKNPTPTSTKTNTKEDSKDVVAQLSIVAKQLTLYPYDKTKNTKIKVPDSSLVRNQIACYNKRTELQKTQANKLVIKSKPPLTALAISDKSSGSIQKIYNMSKIIIRKFKK